MSQLEISCPLSDIFLVRILDPLFVVPRKGGWITVYMMLFPLFFMSIDLAYYNLIVHSMFVRLLKINEEICCF